MHSPFTTKKNIKTIISESPKLLNSHRYQPRIH